MRDNEKKVLAGITQDNELYFLNITTQRDGKPYFSITGDTHAPITVEDAKERVWDNLTDGELWRMAVQAEQTELGLEEWALYVIDTDGNLSGFDNSIFDITVEVDGTEYMFESISCGQHEEKDLKHYFIDKLVFINLMRAWKQYHMKSIDAYAVQPIGCMATLGYLIDNLPVQNLEALAMQAITIINNEK